MNTTQAPTRVDGAAYLQSLNTEQRAACCYGQARGAQQAAGPLLVIAGAGTGKTATLAHRLAWLIDAGVTSDRVLLLTFSRRAADEMVRRAGQALAASSAGQASVTSESRFHIPWSGTFHSIAARLLRRHASILGLAPSFSILDRADSLELFDWLREQAGFASKKSRFPRAQTCLAIYSDRVNTGDELAEVLKARYPWCSKWLADLTTLMRSYVARKQADSVLDYDDLLLWWAQAMNEPVFAQAVRGQFDHVLVDEFQDSNNLQIDILDAVCPQGRGLFVVGDDAQSIYSFRAARVEHIQGFEQRFNPPAARITLHQNYRSTQKILDAANALMAQAQGPFQKNLRANDAVAGGAPVLATVLDDAAQAQYVVDNVLRVREEGVSLKRQAVLFRTAHHSDVLEVMLTRHNIPFVKYGGLKFVEAAHIKDTLAVLRWSRNPDHQLAGFRCLQLIPGMGPVLARRVLDQWLRAQTAGEPRRFETLAGITLPAKAQQGWQGLIDLLTALADSTVRWADQLALLVDWVRPLVALRYDNPAPRLSDLDVLAQIAGQFASAEQFLSDMALDPPNASGDYSDKAQRDEDYLVLSTVHSAKGQEWHSVFVLNVADGNFPNEFSSDDQAAIDEERRLLYVAMTRAERELHLIEPQRYYLTQQARYGAAHVYGARSRFLDKRVLATLEPVNVNPGSLALPVDALAAPMPPGVSEPESETGKFSDAKLAKKIRSLF